MIVELECKECEGQGSTINPIGACRNYSSECCGGCETIEQCDECDVSGNIEVETSEEYQDEYQAIMKKLQSIYNDLTSRGCSATEAKGIINKDLSELMDEL